MRNYLRNILTVTLALSSAFALKATAIPEMEQTYNTVEVPRITMSLNTIHILNANGQRLEIYNITGVLIATYKIDSSEKTITLNLPKSCYMLKVGKIVRKISIL